MGLVPAGKAQNMIAALDAVLAIVALGAIAIILVMLAIVYIPPRNVGTDDVEAPPPAARAKQPLPTDRRKRPMSGMRRRRIRSQTWSRPIEAVVNRLHPWARRTWAEDHGEIPASMLVVACSVVLGYVIVHM